MKICATTKRISIATVAVFIAMVLGLTSGAAESNAETAALHEAYKLSQESFRRTTRDAQEERFKRFRELLPRLAAAGPDVTGTNASEQTLLRVARQAGSRPELIEELLGEYGHWKHKGYSPRVLRPDPLAEKHVTEEYRPAWEALLLAPPSREIDFMMQTRTIITDALGMIANRESLPVLEAAFFAASAERAQVEEGRRALERQLRIIQVLNQFATAEALQSMLRCISAAEAGAAGPLPKIAEHDVREWAVRLLRDEVNIGNGEQWRRVLANFPKDNLTASERELLERATKTPEK